MTSTLSPTAARRVFTSVVLAVAMVATACGGGETAVEAPAATSTPEPAPTATPQPEPTATPEPAPTATPEPEAVAEASEAETENDSEAQAEPEAGAAAEAAEVGDALDPDLVAIAETVWTQSCSSCHGDNGEGASRGRPLAGVALEAPVEQHITSVELGKGRMPGFIEKLTPEEIEAVVIWTRATF